MHWGPTDSRPDPQYIYVRSGRMRGGWAEETSLMDALLGRDRTERMKSDHRSVHTIMETSTM
jgi:hypothetical protein